MAKRRAATAGWRAPSAPPGAREPGPLVLSLLEHGDDGRPTAKLVASVVTGLLSAGWSDELVHRTVWSAPGTAHRVQADDRGRGWLAGVVRRQRLWLQTAGAPGDRAQVRLELAGGWWRALTRKWPKLPGHTVSGRTLTAVLVAVLTLADELGRTRGLAVSVRDLAERSGLSRTTAHRALVALQAHRVLSGERGADRSAGHAATYRLHLDRLPDDSGELEHPGVAPAALQLLTHDGWRGLGLSAWRLWVALDERGPLPVAELAATIGLSDRWCTVLLQRLALHGLVTRTAGGWTRCAVGVAQVRLTVAAEHCGTVGAGERRRAQHRAEREAQRQAREQWTQRRAAEQRTRVWCDPGTGLWWDLDTGEQVGVSVPERELVPEPASAGAPGPVWARAALEHYGRLAEQLTAPYARLAEHLQRELAPLQRLAEDTARQADAVARWAAEQQREGADSG